MCNCHNEIMEKVKEKVDIPDGAADMDFEWKGKVFRLDGKNSDPCPPRVEFSFRAPKKGGGHRSNKTTSSLVVFGSYCTFCGVKYD